MKEEIIDGFEGAPLCLYIWDEVKEPKAVVQIIHGLSEYLALYDEFARLLNDNGYIVFGADNRCMGKSAAKNSKQDPRKIFFDTVEDNITVGLSAKERYGLPLFVYAHGYGSMLALRYIELASDDIDGVFLSSPAPPKKCVDFRVAVASRFGNDNTDNISLRAYAKRMNKKFASEGEKAWMSLNKEYVARIINDSLCNTQLPKGFFYNLRKDLKTCGSDISVSTIRKNLPVLMMAGGADSSGRFGKNIMRLYEMLRDAALTDVRVRVYHGVRHALAQNPQKSELVRDVNEAISEILSRKAEE